MTPVLNANFLDKQYILSCLNVCYCSDNGVDQDFVPWTTSDDWSASAKALSEYLVANGAPKGMRILIKLCEEDEQ